MDTSPGLHLRMWGAEARRGVRHRYAEAWAGFVALERGQRHIPKARTLYKRCYSRRLADGGQPAICEAWLRFEREEGR